MIAKLTGRVDMLKPTELIIDVNGIGFHVSIPLSTYEKIIDLPKVSLNIYSFFREDQVRLFGFVLDEERRLFEILIGISGIGPSIALALLSGLSGKRLVDAVKSDNPDILTKIPGIGKAKAEKIIFEMKRVIKKIDLLTVETDAHPSVRGDAVEALISLGFDEKRSMSAVTQVLSDFPDESIETIIKEALKNIS